MISIKLLTFIILSWEKTAAVLAYYNTLLYAADFNAIKC